MEEQTNNGELRNILRAFEPTPANLISAIQAVQHEFGYVPPHTIGTIAGYLGVFPSEVMGVITFYSQFYSIPCHV